MLYWWAVHGEAGAGLHDPHQHDGVFSALACMETTQLEWEAANPGVRLDLNLTQLDGCIASDMPEGREAQMRAAFANWRKSARAKP